MEANKFELTDKVKDVAKFNKSSSRPPFFDDEDDDYDRFEDEEFMVGIY